MAIENDTENLANIAIGTKISTLDGKEFSKQINTLRKKEVNHEKNMKRFSK